MELDSVYVLDQELEKLPGDVLDYGLYKLPIVNNMFKVIDQKRWMLTIITYGIKYHPVYTKGQST